MAYPIKNSATLQTNSIKAGSFGLGVNQGGYGLTSSTAFWNGKTPNVSGYVLYIGNGTSSPTTYVAKNDSDLISLSNVLGYGPNTTIGQALQAFITNGTVVICVNMDCPNIVTSGLTLYLDASFTPSYPKSGIKWENLSGTAITGSLTNGPTFNSDFYGSIQFDGTNDYVSCGAILNYTSSDFSFSYWVYVTSLTTNVGGEGPVIIWKGDFQNNGYYDQVGQTGQLIFVTNIAGTSVITSTATGVISAGNIYNIAYTRSGSSIRIYVNGVDVTDVAGTHTNPRTSANNFLLASYNGGYLFSNVRLFNVLSYDRQLTPAEVLQNFYAGKKRFIPTNNLLLWLDGENTNTRVTTPVTAIDVSDNFNNASLLNGTSLTHFDAGTSFYFDGVDNYISINNSSLMPTGDYTKVVIFKLQSLSFSNNIMSGNNHFLYTAGGAFLRAGHFVSGQEAISSYTTIVNTWNFAVVTFNSTNGFRIYQNGTTAVGSTSAATASAGGNVILGSVLTGGSFLLQGQIGISMLYDRVLTTSEISDIYQAYKGRFGYV